jgi:hypothetical protein
MPTTALHAMAADTRVPFTTAPRAKGTTHKTGTLDLTPNGSE